MTSGAGNITLPAGEVIRRPPDTVVVITTNISYEGCRGMNQSVLDRMDLAQNVELPFCSGREFRPTSTLGCIMVVGSWISTR